MKTSIQQMTKFLEMKEAEAKHFLSSHEGEGTQWVKASLSAFRVALTESRRLERVRNKPVQYGAEKRPAGPRR
jgi:hypothetical protein